MIRSLPRPLADIALLAARIVLGVVLIAHGFQKLGNGWDATAQGFAGMGIPVAEVAAAFAIAVEIGGGALIILGAFTTVAGVLVVVNMLGALIFAHASAGVFVTEGGWELVAMIATTALVLAAVGAGRLSLDARLPGLRRLGARPVTA